MNLRSILLATCCMTAARCANSQLAPAEPERPTLLRPSSTRKTTEPTSPTPFDEQISVGDLSLILHGCELTTVSADRASQIQKINLPDGCTFGKNADGSIQIQRTTQGQTLLVVSSKLAEGQGHDCETRVRGVVISGGVAKISSKEKASSMCGSVGPFEEPLFVVLAASIR